MSQEQDRVTAYMEVVARLEPNITMIDRDAALASIAISLKRIADVVEVAAKPDRFGNNLTEKIYYAIYNPLMEAMAHWMRSR